MKHVQKKGVYSKKIRDRWYIFEKERPEVRELNEVAGFIWELLKAPISIDKIVTKVCRMYKVNKIQAKVDTERFLKDYKKNEFIEEIKT